MKSFVLLLLLASVSTKAQTLPLQAEAPALAYKPRPKGVVVTEAVAQAGGHVVTSREVLISHILDEALSTPVNPKKSPERKAWLLDPKSEAFAKQLAQILLELVVQMEAENFSIGQVSQSEIQVAEKQVEEQVKGWEPWQKLDVSSAEVRQMLMRKMRSKNFLKFKIDSSGVQISDGEAKAFYEKNRVKFGNLPFAQFQEGIKEALAQSQLQEKLKDWFDILKRKYRVRYLGGA